MANELRTIINVCPDRYLDLRGLSGSQVGPGLELDRAGEGGQLTFTRLLLHCERPRSPSSDLYA
jgi:hypothetical protein